MSPDEARALADRLMVPQQRPKVNSAPRRRESDKKSSQLLTSSP